VESWCCGKSRGNYPFLRSIMDLETSADILPDLSAAKHADVLFAKEMENGASDLMVYCKREVIPYVPFTDL